MSATSPDLPPIPEHITTRRAYRAWRAALTGTTQAAHPWRATLRTLVALLIGLAALAPAIVDASGLDAAWPPVAGALAVAAGITRVLALPAVEDFLAAHPWTAWLSAAGRRQDRGT